MLRTEAYSEIDCLRGHPLLEVGHELVLEIRGGLRQMLEFEGRIFAGENQRIRRRSSKVSVERTPCCRYTNVLEGLESRLDVLVTTNVYLLVLCC